MNTISSRTEGYQLKFSLPILLLLCFSQCAPNSSSELTVVNIQLCDNYDKEVNCIEPVPEQGIVKLKPTVSAREKSSWYHFSNFLYFTARETPGFVITFSRPFTPEERAVFNSEYVAYITLDGIRERMEGYEMGEDKIASFHYLGAILKEVKRHNKEQDQKPNLEKFGNLLLQFEISLPNKDTKSLQREIKLEWE